MEEKRYCPECCCNTLQAAVPSDPDCIDAPLVWMCTNCLELVDIVDELE
jgi:hypothetical protein